ncbi:hypothetical protein TWF696_001063 [Orbilia brochopaga]|uniref:Uncharacterized protein n=1 Tax=Orbilia brochopaga TaxID=3140254 RepID=A0AAV9VD88_9PEZI
MTNRRSRRPPPLNLKAISPVAPYLQSSTRYPLPRDEESLHHDVRHPFPPERSYVDNMVEGLHQDGPSGQTNDSNTITNETNQDSPSKPRARRYPVKYRPPSREIVPKINRPYDEVFERLREEGGSSRQDREKYRGVQYSQTQDPHMRDNVPSWYLEGQSKLVNPLKYGSPGSKYRQPPHATNLTVPRRSPPTSHTTSQQASFSIQQESSRMGLPTSPVRLVPSVTMEDIRQAGGNPTPADVEEAVQKDIEDAMAVTELYRKSQALSTSDKGSNYVQTLRRTSFTSPVKNEDHLQAAGQQARSETETSDPEGKTLEGVLDYYTHIPSVESGEGSDPDPSAPVASVKEVTDNQWGSRTWNGKAKPLSPSEPVLVQVGDNDRYLDKEAPSLEESISTPDTLLQNPISLPEPAFAPTSQEISHETAVIDDNDSSPPPPIPLKRRQTQPHTIVGSHSPPHEIKSLRHQPVLVQHDEESFAAPPVPPKVPLSPILEAPRTPKDSPKVPNSTRFLTPSQEHGRAHAVAVAAEAGPSIASSSIGSMAKQLNTYIDDYGSHQDHINRVDKAFKKMGVIPEESVKSNTPHPIPNKITKDLNRLNTRKAILEGDGPKSPNRKLFSFSGAPKSLKAVAGIFGIRRSKEQYSESVPSSPRNQQHPRRPSLDPALLVGSSSRPGVLDRLFGSNSRPSTADSNKSFGISLPESWGSGRGSGETGVTSHIGNCDSNTPPITPSSPRHVDAYNGEASPRIRQKNGSDTKSGSPKSSPSKTNGKGKKQVVKPKKSGFFDVFKRSSGDETTDNSADEASASRKKKDKGKGRATDIREPPTQSQGKKSLAAGPGFYGTKGTFFRAKNPLELELCDDSDAEAYRPKYMKHAFSDEDDEQIAEPFEPLNQGTPLEDPNPLYTNPTDRQSSTSEAHQDGRTDGQKSPKDEIEDAEVTPKPEYNEEKSKWSEDSEDDIESSIGSIWRSHKRNGSGSSALGPAPTLMMKAAQRLKGHKKSTPSPDKSSPDKSSPDKSSPEGSEKKYVPPPVQWAFPPHIPPPFLKSPSNSNGNRDSSGSGVSSGKSESENLRNSIIAPPPIPPRARPAPTSVPTPDDPSQEHTACPGGTPITSGTYHDKSSYIIRRFGSNIGARSESSMGHRSDRNSIAPSIPERSRTSLGHNITDVPTPNKRSFSESAQTDKITKAQAKRNKKMEQVAKKEAAKVEKLTKKAETAAQRHAEALHKAGLLSAASHGQWV